mmetsp:Transcript_15982/g.48175  ORF Transcript_15982/g.48175 Transcript_15982/m.48175 type:complete len:221 (+) Transcript_15982:259-921(+)
MRLEPHADLPRTPDGERSQGIAGELAVEGWRVVNNHGQALLSQVGIHTLPECWVATPLGRQHKGSIGLLQDLPQGVHGAGDELRVAVYEGHVLPVHGDGGHLELPAIQGPQHPIDVQEDDLRPVLGVLDLLRVAVFVEGLRKLCCQSVLLRVRLRQAIVEAGRGSWSRSRRAVLPAVFLRVLGPVGGLSGLSRQVRRLGGLLGLPLGPLLCRLPCGRVDD